MFLRNFLNIGYLDLQFIEQYHALIDGLADYQGLKDLTLEQLNANVIIYEIFICINQEVFSTIRKKIKNDDFILPFDSNIKPRVIKKRLLKSCDDRMSEFSPFINSIDSWFQNELDHVDVKNRTLEEIVSNVFDILAQDVIE